MFWSLAGLKFAEVMAYTRELLRKGDLDFLDMSLWDCFKEPVEAEFKGKSLLQWYAPLQRGRVRLGVTGKLLTAAQAQSCLDAGADFVIIGRGAILHHDWPRRALQDPHFRPVATPVTPEHLRREGLSAKFIRYMENWKGFVSTNP